MFARVLVVAACFGFAAAQTVTLQAESAALSGVTIATAVPGYTGQYLNHDSRHNTPS